MSNPRRFGGVAGPGGRIAGRAPKTRGAQLVEFGFALPILLLLVMGAWDFGSAFLLQDKMTNAAREAARISASNSLSNPATAQPCVTGPTPCTIVASVNALKLYMTNAGTDLSCIDPNSPTSTAGEKFTYTCKSPAVTVVIDRGATVTQGLLVLTATQVSFTYPVTWWLANLFPKGFFPSQLSTTVTMRNLIP